MKKTEIINKLGEAYAKLEDAQGTVTVLEEELNKIKSILEELPAEVDEIEDDDAEPE